MKWAPFARVPQERWAEPLPGFKLAYPMVSADGSRGAFSGVMIGRGSIYGVIADAECAQGARHHSPSRWCDCGFYCVHTLDDAWALALDPDYLGTVILEVTASGRFIRYERGLRYARQRVTAVRVGRCGCGDPATVLGNTGHGMHGWRQLRPVCAVCVGGRSVMPLTEFARLLGGLPVEPEGAVLQLPLSESAAAPARPAPDTVDRAALIPLLSAEVTLLQARLDEVQRQLARLTAGDE